MNCPGSLSSSPSWRGPQTPAALGASGDFPPSCTALGGPATALTTPQSAVCHLKGSGPSSWMGSGSKGRDWLSACIWVCVCALGMCVHICLQACVCVCWVEVPCSLGLSCCDHSPSESCRAPTHFQTHCLLQLDSADIGNSEYSPWIVLLWAPHRGAELLLLPKDSPYYRIEKTSSDGDTGGGGGSQTAANPRLTRLAALCLTWGLEDRRVRHGGSSEPHPYLSIPPAEAGTPKGSLGTGFQDRKTSAVRTARG